MWVKTIMEKARERYIPLSVCMELTYRCNVRCHMCYLNILPAESKVSDELSYEEVLSVLDQLAEAGTLFLKLTGGEVFVREDFLDIAFAAKARGFSMYIKTNGTLITDPIARRLKELAPACVDISLLGASAATHDKIMGVPGFFEKAVNGLKLLQKYGVLTAVSTTLLKQNQNELLEIQKIGRQVGAIRTNHSDLISPKVDGSKTNLKTSRLKAKELENFWGNQNQMMPEGSEDFMFEGTMNTKNPKANLEMCNAGRSYCVISPSGDVKLCVVFSKKFGNFRLQPFVEIWDNAVELQKLRSINDSGQLTGCRTCAVIQHCRLSHAHCAGYVLCERIGPSIESCRMAFLEAGLKQPGSIKVSAQS